MHAKELKQNSLKNSVFTALFAHEQLVFVIEHFGYALFSILYNRFKFFNLHRVAYEILKTALKQIYAGTNYIFIRLYELLFKFVNL